MKKGDKIVTSSGIIGVLHKIDEDSALVDVGSNVKIRDLLTRALFTAKNGFSVVAPIKVIVPFSIEGSKASC
mgnify:CR=1 FL=1